MLAAIEAAQLAGDLQLAWRLSFRYRLDVCPVCVQRPVRFGELRWALPHSETIAAAKTAGRGFLHIKTDDTRFDSVHVCGKCWLRSDLPNGWFHAEVK